MLWISSCATFWRENPPTIWIFLVPLQCPSKLSAQVCARVCVSKCRCGLVCVWVWVWVCSLNECIQESCPPYEYTHVWHDSCIYVTTRSYVWRDSCICVRTRSILWSAYNKCVTRLKYMCHNTFIRGTWLMYMCQNKLYFPTCVQQAFVAWQE